MERIDPQVEAEAPIRGRLRPVRHRGGWIAGGLGCQLVGVGVPIAYVVTKAKHESIGGLLTTATVKLAWHESLHARAGIALLAAGAIIFALGSVLLARPFVQRKLTLLVAVPLAAACGAAVLGVAALVIALVVLIAEGGGDLSNITGNGGSGSAKRKPSSEREPTPAASAGQPGS